MHIQKYTNSTVKRALYIYLKVCEAFNSAYSEMWLLIWLEVLVTEVTVTDFHILSESILSVCVWSVDTLLVTVLNPLIVK